MKILFHFQKFYLRRVFFIVVSATILSLIACSTPPVATPKIHQFLIGQCKALITDPSIAAYQYTVQSPMGRGVFALAIDGHRQVCGQANVRDGTNDWARLEVLALARCNDMRANYKINTPCKVFAKNFEIVWDEKRRYGLE
jgi:hypothetical protein